MPELSKTARGEAMPEKEDRSEDWRLPVTSLSQLRTRTGARSISVLPSLKTIINFDQMIKANPRGSDRPSLRPPRQATTMLRI